MAEEFGEYYAIPVLLSFDGIDKQVNSAIGKTVTVAGTKAGKDFGDALASGVKASQSEVKRALNDYTKLYDKAADAADKLKVAEAGLKELQDKGITSGKRYEAAIAAKNKARRDEKRIIGEATDAYKDYEDAVKSAESASDGAGENAAQGFLEGFSGSIAALGSKAGPIGAALTAAAALGVGAGVAIGKEVMAGFEREVAADRIQAQIGLSDADAEKFGQQAGGIYAGNFGESFGDVQQSMADVASTIGASSPALEDITRKALTFRDVFGTEVSESVAFAQNLIVNGLAPDAASAFDLMVKAYQKVPAAMRDELPEVMNEYSTFVSSLGFSSAEAFGLIVKNAPKGKIAIDKVGDALKEFTLLATDIESKPVFGTLTDLGLDAGKVANNLLAGGEQAGEQFDIIIEKLQQIPDLGQRVAATKSLFGTPLEDLDLAKTDEFLQSLVDMETGLKDVNGAAQDMVDTVGDNAAGSIESALRDIETARSGMQDALADAFGPHLEDLATWVTNNEDTLVSFFTTAANAAADFGGATVTATGMALQAIAYVGTGMGDVVGGILEGIEYLVAGVASTADALGADGLAEDLREAREELKTAKNDAYGMGEGFADLAKQVTETGLEITDFDAAITGAEESARRTGVSLDEIGTKLSELPEGHAIEITDNSPETIQKLKDLGFEVTNTPTGLSITAKTSDAEAAVEEWRRLQQERPLQIRAAAVLPGNVVPGPSGDIPPLTVGSYPSFMPRADGGPIFGPGGPRSDLIPILASNDEHMWTAEEVDAIGGHTNMFLLRSLVRSGGFRGFADGGPVGIDALYNAASGMVGTPYSQASRDDCSGSIAQLVNAALGLPLKGDLMSTYTAADWLPAKGAIMGRGPAGTFRIGWSSTHMAATLPDGTNVEQGGSSDTFTMGGSAAGADDPQFTNHAYLPLEALYPEGMPYGGAVSPYGSGYSSGGSGGTPGIGPNGERGTYTVDQADVADAEGKVREADAEVREAEARKREIDADADASESQRIKAENDLAKARADADKSRRELGEAQRGKFTASTGGSGGSTGNPLKDLVSIFGGGILETFGLDGSWLPDIANLMPLQMADTLLNAFVPMATANSGAPAQTSGGGFGMPDMSLPPLPPPGVHGSRAGAPAGPGGPSAGPIDLSTHFHSNVGMDPDTIAKKTRRGQDLALNRIQGLR